jgi:hypothetical protein
MTVHIIEISNPFEPFNDTARHTAHAGVSVRDWLQQQYPGFVEFDRPTICIINGDPVLRADWGRQLNDGDIVNLVAVPGDPVTTTILIAVVVGVAVAAIAISMMPPPKTPGAIPEADPVYSLTGQRNQIRLMQPIEAAYGRVRVWPSYAARAYNSYRDNDQYQYQLFCVTQGQFQFERVSIEDTAVESFQDVETEAVQPGNLVTLFPDNVETSTEVAGLELYGPNESSYESWREFVANSSGTRTTRLEVDATISTGLYYANDDGGLNERTITAEWEYRQIDDNGNAVGAWASLASFSKTLKTVTPQRFTLTKTVPSGRYAVRARRTNDASDSHRVGDTLLWSSLRAFMPSTKDYGDVTMLAVAARATNNLNDQSASRINAVGTRMLPVWNKTTRTWSEPQQTRSIVWAFCDVFRSAYGGRMDDSMLDLDHLFDLDLTYSSRGEYFDWVFDSKITVWEAAKTIARCGRAVPIISGSIITMVRDEPATLPVAMFTQENIVSGSFKWDITLIDDSDYDSVEIEYTEPSGWTQETVQCVMPDRAGDYPQSIKLPGCTDRSHAYHEGMYIAARDRYIRETFTFKTGLEGHIPTFGDLIAITHDLPRWGAGGFVESITGRVVDVSEPVSFTTSNHYLVFRKKDGSATGTYLVTAGDHDQQLILTTDLDDELFFSSATEPPMFMFGAADAWSKLGKVVSIKPGDADTIEITAESYEAVVHTFDALAAPDSDASVTPASIPALPTVTGLRVSQLPDTLTMVQVSWSPALGAKSYVLQQSNDGVNWSLVEQLTGTSYTLPVIKGYLYLRVAGVNLGAGSWSTWEGEVGVTVGVPNNVIGLQLQTAFTGTFAKIQWTSVVNATSYRIRVYQDAGATLMRIVDVSGLSYTYSIENAMEDGTPARSLRFSVVGVNANGESETAAVLDVQNPVPAVLSGVYSEVFTDTTEDVKHTVGWTASSDVDIDVYRVWASGTSGFTADASTLVYEGAVSQGQVVVEKVGGVAPTYYWRVAAIDIWGDEVNLSTEQLL